MYRTFAFAAGAALLLASVPASAQWYVSGSLGVSSLSDDSASPIIGPGLAGDLNAEFDAGLVAGGALGRRLGDRWRAELAYTYLSADVDRATLPDGLTADGDNYASTGLAANLLYHFNDDVPGENGFSPYVGVGLVWLNEIDIDLEGGGVSRAYEDLEGDEVSAQLILGVQRAFRSRWSWGAELRYLPVGGVDLSNDQVSIRDLDYDSLSAALTLTYWWE